VEAEAMMVAREAIDVAWKAVAELDAYRTVLKKALDALWVANCATAGSTYRSSTEAAAHHEVFYAAIVDIEKALKP
jgi:hypothetical protein